MTQHSHMSDIDRIETEFHVLAESAHPLRLDAGEIGVGAPGVLVDVADLRTLLVSGTAPARVRDAVWARLVGNAQVDRDRWMIGAAWMLLPGLRGLARVARWRCPYGDSDDVAGEIVAGFVEAVLTVDAHMPGLYVELFRRARRTGDAYCRSEQRESLHQTAYGDVEPVAVEEQPGPETVLVEAVAAGVLGPIEAELIGVTRIGRQPLTVVAAERGLSYDGCHKRRRRAERRLVAYLTEPSAPTRPGRQSGRERPLPRRAPGRELVGAGRRG
jgi:hypothetical protein